MENVQGFKKVKSEFEQLLEEKLPGHHDSELLLHVSWRRLMQFNLTPSCPFLHSGISAPIWISMRPLVVSSHSVEIHRDSENVHQSTNLQFRITNSVPVPRKDYGHPVSRNRLYIVLVKRDLMVSAAKSDFSGFCAEICDGLKHSSDVDWFLCPQLFQPMAVENT